MKILILIICSRDSPEYIKMKELLLNYYSKIHNIEFYFINHKKINTDIEFDNHDININGVESRAVITKKTVLAMKFCKDKSFDFCVRSNISTVIDVNKLLIFLKNIPQTNIYCGGQFNNTGDAVDGRLVKSELLLDLPFVGGTSIIISKDIYNSLCDNSDKIDYSLIDDVAMALYIKLNHFDILTRTNKYTHPNYNAEIFWVDEKNISQILKNEIKTKKIVFYRHRTLNRATDVENMTQICDYVINNKNNDEYVYIPKPISRLPIINIIFFARHFTYDDTELSLYNYARYNEEILGNKSYIVCFREDSKPKELGFTHRESFDRFKQRFTIIEIDYLLEIKQIIETYNISFFYTQTHGGSDIYHFDNKEIWGNCSTIKHCVYTTTVLDADHNICLTPMLNVRYNTNLPVIPYIVWVPPFIKDLRKDLNIPAEATVFGRNGVFGNFNIDYVKEAIKEIVLNDTNKYFLFMNTEKFYNHPRIIHIESNLNLIYRTRFINTCDAMINGNSVAETFNLYIAEFSFKNKPIITSRCGGGGHIKILGDKAVIYDSKEELLQILKDIRSIISLRTDWNAYKQYSAKYVMSLFQNIFLTKENIIPTEGKWITCGKEGEIINLPIGTKVRYGWYTHDWVECFTTNSTICASNTIFGDPAPCIGKIIQRFEPEVSK